jgi:hypothetical protein
LAKNEAVKQPSASVKPASQLVSNEGRIDEEQVPFKEWLSWGRVPNPAGYSPDSTAKLFLDLAQDIIPEIGV